MKRKKSTGRAPWVRFCDSNGTVHDAVSRSDRIRDQHVMKALCFGAGRAL